ncbi:unnamed protein product [Owenia fusiformis]|uniref:Sodium/glucose cotransporter 4 n=1 Tax=Owenia fusiformis TaxID=6347 RepID=A0A8S4Q5N4_OWEFU|nr:unnamed protein product [Owenia fusiformis]
MCFMMSATICAIILTLALHFYLTAAFNRVGGYESMTRRYFSALPNTTIYSHNETCGIPPRISMNMFRPITDGSYPWTGVIFGLTISSIWYWCSDQVIVQRALSAKNISYAKAGTILAGYLKFLPLWIIVFPGMIARILYPDEIACTNPDICKRVCNQESGCTNIAYPLLVIRLMPNFVRGLMLAVMMSALMSSLTSIFNSSSTIFTMDVWTRIRKQASETELMIVGRVFVLFLVAIGIVWIPIVQNFSELFHYIQSVTSYLSPPVCAVYVLAVFWKRTNEPGAFYGLLVGLLVGMTRFIWEFSYPKPSCGQEDTRPAIIKDVHYLHFGILLFGITVIVTVTVSLLTKPMPDKYLRRLTFWDRFNKEAADNVSLMDKDELAEQNKHIEEKQAKSSEQAPVVEQPELEEELPWYKTACNWICGIEKMVDQPQLTDEEIRALQEKQNSIYEEPTWRRVLNANAIILMVVAIFFWGFYH